MDNDIQQLVASFTERIEVAYLSAVKRYGDSFVVFLLDLDDPQGRACAEGLCAATEELAGQCLGAENRPAADQLEQEVAHFRDQGVHPWVTISIDREVAEQIHPGLECIDELPEGTFPLVFVGAGQSTLLGWEKVE